LLAKKGIPENKIQIKTLSLQDVLQNGSEPDIYVRALNPEEEFNSKESLDNALQDWYTI